MCDVTSFEFDFEPEATNKVLRQSTPEETLISFAPERLLGEELLVVMAKTNSIMAYAFVYDTAIGNAK
ncbi:MAG: hypothetical protein B7Y47_13860 [Sphingomonas sp. 28-63-12]|nr:MAG: hypothetical protein B7Y47_13860 [Sphingomonas sp. 28-63-12]